MKSIIAIQLLFLSVVASNMATAATTADLQVKGQITPDACTFFVAGSGTSAVANFAYGDIEGSTLLSGEMAELSNKYNNFGIVCSAPSLVGLRFTDNRIASEFDGTHPSAPNQTDARAGLGWDASGNPIGFAILGTTGYPLLNNMTGSGATGRFLFSLDNGSTWGVAAQNAWGVNFESILFSFTDATGFSPVPIRDVMFYLGLRAYLAPKESLDVSREVTLDGSITAEIVYI